MFEKIKINLSYKAYNQIISDMESFQFYKENGDTNLNLFINIIIKGMYERNKELNSIMMNTIQAKLTQFDNSTIDEITDLLVNSLNARLEDRTNRSVGYYISYRPSKKYEEMYNEIEVNELKNTTISNYFRMLLNEYIRLNQDEREAIVFKDTLALIKQAISSKRMLTLKDKNLTSFIPYEIVKTNDELYNYVIGGKRKNGILHPFSLHIYKCTSFVKEKNHFSLTEDEKAIFERIIERGPREIEIRSQEVIVTLSKNGQKQFKKYYLNRPIPTKIEGDNYYFNSSVENIFHYFARFGSNAKIISPLNLRNQMKNFHKHAYNSYQD